MKAAQHILSILIGESEASACFDEIDHRIYPEDSCDLKGHIRHATVEKYLKAADLSIPDLFQKIRDHSNLLALDVNIKEIEEIKKRLTSQLIRKILQELDVEPPN